MLLFRISVRLLRLFIWENRTLILKHTRLIHQKSLLLYYVGVGNGVCVCVHHSLQFFPESLHIVESQLGTLVFVIIMSERRLLLKIRKNKTLKDNNKLKNL
jgi:hypothetical protein